MQYYLKSSFPSHVYTAISNEPGGYAYSYCQSEKYSTSCHRGGTEVTGLRPITHRETKIITVGALLLVSVFTLKRSVKLTE